MIQCVFEETCSYILVHGFCFCVCVVICVVPFYCFTVNLFHIQLAWNRFSRSNKCRCIYLRMYVYVSMHVRTYVCKF